MKALVTRSSEDSERLVSALAERGVGALLAPLVEIVFLPVPAPDLEGVQGVLATSANGVRALARLCQMRRLPLLAVGDTTAETARAFGFENVESAAGALPDLLALACRRFEPGSGRLLHVAGKTLAGDLKSLLEARGFAVERATLYEARMSSSLSAQAVEALASGTIDFAFFFSPRTASAFAGLAERARVASFCAAIRAFSLSPATDKALGPLPWRQRLVAQKPNLPALLEALDGILGERRHIRKAKAER